ncbi:hypothetical protein [Halanaerobium]|uniref:Uncharacterized protein n=1 Tax=Halanaerobium saccharolyticum TaxID=43595 RepID=A0A4R6LMJ0_9FIRM|nr:hypothetical protein [Halanaerobium]RCW60159.1 hypothetical protein DFR80_1082 [Halanaerobium sp. ST460_2HS_T2]TDO86458.1 hypothetical protein DFR79_11430 [Halanaerobium saccharolyticum]
MAKDITNKLERLEVFEEKFNIDLDGLYCESDENNNIFITGEVHLKEGNELDQDIQILAVCYDDKNRVIKKSEFIIYDNKFFGFEVLQISIYELSQLPNKIRIYPNYL